MDEVGPGFRIFVVLVLVGLAATLMMNTCAIDRIEQQVLQNRTLLEDLAKVVEDLPAGGPVSAGSPQAVARIPGEPSGAFALGWGREKAEIRFVEGAAPNAPLTLRQKPRPQGDVYVNRRSASPKSLNIYTTNEGDTRRMVMNVLDTLLRLNPKAPSEVLPSLAVEWQVSDDKLTYTYRLRKGVLFADGRPFTAADVKFSFDVMRDPQVKADHLRSSFEDVESVESPDDYTVVVRYRKPFWAGLYKFGLDLRILNKGWYEAEIPNFAKRFGVEEFATTPGAPGFSEVFNKIRFPCPGTGPYYYSGDRYEPGTDGVELVQNPFSWTTQVRPLEHNLGALKWIFISDAVAAFEEFRKGTFDVSVVDHQQWDDELSKDPTIERIAEYHTYDHIGLGHSAITWNTRKGPFDDARVRRAMTHLIDREWMLKEIERGRGNIAVCNSKRIYPTYSTDLEPLPHDIEKAKALLAEAGWADTDGDGVLDKDGKPFEFELKVGSTRAFYTQLAGLLEDACKKVGVRMTLRTLEWATFIEDYYSREFDGMVLYHSWPDPFIDPYEAYHSSQDVPRGGNAPGWRDPEVDKVLEAMRTEFDDAKRVALFHEFNRLFQQAQPRTLLLEGQVGVLVNKRFSGVEVLPAGLRSDLWWVEPDKVKYR